MCHNPPPYKETPAWFMPIFDALLTGFSLKQGESVWAPITLKPVLLGSKSDPI